MNDETGDIDWQKVEQDQHEGRIAANIYQGDDNKVYFYLGG